jgi:hypothetical protein
MIAIMHQKMAGIRIVFVSILALLGGIIFAASLLTHSFSHRHGKDAAPQSQASSINRRNAVQFIQIGPIRIISN